MSSRMPRAGGSGSAQIGVPTTVVHGTADPVFPLGNGEALAREIPGARLVTLPGGGHELPPSAWAAVVDAICAEDFSPRD